VTVPDIDMLARRFHEAYERLAPDYGYETRPESAVPWEDVPEANRRLMIAVCEEVVGPLVALVEKGEARSRLSHVMPNARVAEDEWHRIICEFVDALRDARATLAGEDVPGSDHGVFSPGNEAGIDPAHTDEQTVRDARDALQRLGDNAIFMSEARKWYEAVAALDRLEAERGEAREPLTLRDGLDLADRAESAEAEIVRLRAALEEIVKQIPMAEGRNILVADSYDGTANPVILHIANAALAGEDA